MSDEDAIAFEDWTPDVYSALVPWPRPFANKYSRGQVAVVAGSSRFPGAAILCARAAAKGGAGYVQLFTPHAAVAAAQANLVCAPVVSCPDSHGAFAKDAADTILANAGHASAFVVGPGLTATEGTRALVEALIQRCDKPLLLDADALNLATQLRPRLAERALAGKVTVLTPHEGEASRLLASIGAATLLPEAPADGLQRYNAAAALSSAFAATVVLKGPGTLIAAADGRRVVRNPSGTAALSTAGTGDVLSGLIGSLLSCGLGSLDACALGAYVHGLAGQEAARRSCELCVTAEDVIRALPSAFEGLRTGEV